jgi:hypothetical protein
MKRKIPEITAYCLEEASDILIRKGIKFHLKETVPPFLSRSMQERGQEEVTRYRVLKQTMLSGGTLELVIAKEVI